MHSAAPNNLGFNRIPDNIRRLCQRHGRDVFWRSGDQLRQKAVRILDKVRLRKVRIGLEVGFPIKAYIDAPPILSDKAFPPLVAPIGEMHLAAIAEQLMDFCGDRFFALDCIHDPDFYIQVGELVRCATPGRTVVEDA